jgi:hypothetical protein
VLCAQRGEIDAIHGRLVEPLEHLGHFLVEGADLLDGRLLEPSRHAAGTTERLGDRLTREGIPGDVEVAAKEPIGPVERDRREHADVARRDHPQTRPGP